MRQDKHNIIKIVEYFWLNFIIMLFWLSNTTTTSHFLF